MCARVNREEQDGVRRQGEKKICLRLYSNLATDKSVWVEVAYSLRFAAVSSVKNESMCHTRISSRNPCSQQPTTA